jgi:hypothetical protein
MSPGWVVSSCLLLLPKGAGCGIMTSSEGSMMANLLEYVGCIHIYLGPYRGNPIALYLKRGNGVCEIGPKAYPWNDVVGMGETPNRAAADFEEKWKAKGLSPDMYTGPSWEGGIKPEKPAPPKPAAPPKPPAAAASECGRPAPVASLQPADGSPAVVTSPAPESVASRTGAS